MKIGIKSMVKKRTEIEKAIVEEVNYINKLIQEVSNEERTTNIADKINLVVTIESELDKNYQYFLKVIEQEYVTPFYWEELFDLYIEVKKIFSLLVLFINKNNMVENPLNFSSFFVIQQRVMNNIQEFLNEYFTNRKYVNELLKNNKYEIKELLKNYLEIVAKNLMGKEHYGIKLKAIDVLESIVNTDEKIQDILMKIMIASGVL